MSQLPHLTPVITTYRVFSPNTSSSPGLIATGAPDQPTRASYGGSTMVSERSAPLMGVVPFVDPVPSTYHRPPSCQMRV